MNPYDHYQSPFSWRYGSDAMRRLWSETNKRRVWRRIWVALAENQACYGLISPDQVAELKSHQEEVDIEEALRIEGQIHHDLMAELRHLPRNARSPAVCCTWAPPQWILKIMPTRCA